MATINITVEGSSSSTELGVLQLQQSGTVYSCNEPFRRLDTTTTTSAHLPTQAVGDAPTPTSPDPISTTESALPSIPTRVFDVAPSNVPGRTRKIFLTGLIIFANLVQMISNLTTIAAGLSIAPSLGIAGEPSQANWIAAAYSLTQGTFVLISGRLGSIYGHKTLLLVGGAWFSICSLANGFCTSYISFTIARALTGIGGALIMPNAVAMISITVGPGRMRNLSVASFAASAPLGGWLGALIVAIITPWKWVCLFLAMLGAAVFGLLWFLLPRETPVHPHGKIDYIGAALGVSGLVLFNFVWNQAPSVGWHTSYEIVLLVMSVAIFAGFIVWENRFAKEPIMPISIFKALSFSALILVVLLSYMSFSISLWYMLAWQQLLRSWTLLDIAVGWIPFAVGAIMSTVLAAWLIPRLAAQWIVVIGVGAAGVSNLLLATMPERQSYWAQTFPAILVGSFCPDLVYTAAQIIASNSVSRRQQGVARSLIGTLNLYGNSLGLGFAGTIERQVNLDEIRGNHVPRYRAALYFGVGIAIVAMLLDAWLVRMPKDEREGWEDENDYDPADAVILASRVAVQQTGLEEIRSRAA